MRKMTKLAACVCVLLLLIALGESRHWGNCCMKYQQNRILHKFLKSYRVQEDTSRCNLRAIIFKTKYGRMFCGDPEKRWVIRSMEFLDNKKERTALRQTN